MHRRRSATISLNATKGGSPAANLSLATDGAPTSAPYGNYTVELVRVGFGQPPIACLRGT